MRVIEDKTKLMKRVEATFNEPLEETLRYLYVDEGKRVDEVAETMSISYVTAYKWLKLAGIYSRRLNIPRE